MSVSYPYPTSVSVFCKLLSFACSEMFQSVVRYASVAGPEFSMGLLHAVLPRNIKPQLELIIQVSASGSVWFV